MTRKTGYCPQHGEVQGEPDALCPLQCEEYLEPVEDYEGAGYFEPEPCPFHGKTSLDMDGYCMDCKSHAAEELTQQAEGWGMYQASNEQVGGAHYKDLPIQPAYFSTVNDLGFLGGNVVKRICRWNRPGGKGLQDIDKAIHELQLLKEFAEGE